MPVYNPNNVVYNTTCLYIYQEKLDPATTLEVVGIGSLRRTEICLHLCQVPSVGEVNPTLQKSTISIGAKQIRSNFCMPIRAYKDGCGPSVHAPFFLAPIFVHVRPIPMVDVLWHNCQLFGMKDQRKCWKIFWKEKI